MSLTTDLTSARDTLVPEAALFHSWLHGPAPGTGSLFDVGSGLTVKTPAKIAADVVASMADGTSALPGLALASDTSTGFYNAGNGSVSGKALGFAQGGKRMAVLQYRKQNTTDDNVYFNFGTGQAITDLT